MPEDAGEDIAARLANVRARIQRAAEGAGRDPSSVRLIAVSKRQSVQKIRAAYAAGQRDFGENYAQELLKKREELAELEDLRFHMIGHVQTNKAGKLVGAVSAIHTLDSARLAAELGKRAEARPVPVPQRLSDDGRLVVFIEVNVSREAQKSGCAPEALAELIARVRVEPALRLAGLMAVPAPDDEQQSLELARLRAEHGVAVLPELSLGMSGDLDRAIAHGSTCVRVGTAIFGERA